MPSSTPGFVGERLREARQVRGLRAVQLSEMLNISPQAVSSYETGKKTPSPDIADAIAHKLNLPGHFFTLPARSNDERTVFYRSMSATTQTARRRAEFRQLWLEDLANYLSDYVEFPEIRIPNFDIPVDPMLISNDDIEHIANETRKFWRMAPDGPVRNMIYLLENQGVIVARDNLGAVTLDGLSTFTDRPYVVIGTDKGTAVRWRFDGAHELGHLILHRNLNPKNLTRPADFKKIEGQAHRFAAAFLLPMSAFAEDFFSASLDALRAIKPKWRVSIAMMIMRAQHGNLISEEHERRLWINYSRRGWRGMEPLDDTLEVEEPRLLRSAVEMIASPGGQGGADLSHAVGLSDLDIESLCALPTGYLRQMDRPTMTLRTAGTQAKVYEFPSVRSSNGRRRE
jgi:Zn-dependent peptidase ImmA (M78 family)/transcriptional regulator with XRE-family HTH domain